MNVFFILKIYWIDIKQNFSFLYSYENDERKIISVRKIIRFNINIILI